MAKTILLCSAEEMPRIDPKDIPDYVYDGMFPLLFSSLTRLFRDPANVEDYERWKRERNGEAKT